MIHKLVSSMGPKNMCLCIQVAVLIEKTYTHTQHWSCDNTSLPLQVIFSFHLGKLKLNEFSASIGLMIHSVIFVLLCLSISSFQSKTHFIAPRGIFHVYTRKQTRLCSLTVSLFYSELWRLIYELVDCFIKLQCHWGKILLDYSDL